MVWKTCPPRPRQNLAKGNLRETFWIRLTSCFTVCRLVFPPCPHPFFLKALMLSGPLASEIDAVSSLHSFLFFGWFFATMLNLYTGWLFHVLLRALYGGCVYIYIFFFLVVGPGPLNIVCLNTPWRRLTAYNHEYKVLWDFGAGSGGSWWASFWDVSSRRWSRRSEWFWVSELLWQLYFQHSSSLEFLKSFHLFPSN